MLRIELASCAAINKHKLLLSMRTPPPITIVIASLCDDKRAEKLKRACESVRAMADDLDYAIIVVANGNRVSMDLMRWLEARTDTRVFRLRSGSHPLARRVGAELTESEFLGFLDDDDELMPGTLSRKLEYFRAHPHVDVLITDGFRVNGSTCRPIFPPPAERKSDLIEMMMQVGWSACSLTLRAGRIDLAVFDTELRHLEWTMTALSLARRHQTGYLDEPTFRYYEDTPESLSKNNAHSLAAPEIWSRLMSDYAGTPYEKAIRRRYGSECHVASWQHACQGNLREAWRLHAESLGTLGGLLAYLPYSRKLILPTLRRFFS